MGPQMSPGFSKLEMLCLRPRLKDRDFAVKSNALYNRTWSENMAAKMMWLALPSYVKIRVGFMLGSLMV